jgi:hypothetical protein
VTLVELLIAVTITTCLSVVFGGIITAVHSAREHSEGLEEATAQAQVSLERMRYLVSHAGTYRTAGQPTTVGLAVVTRRWSIVDLPEVLVVWCGGRNGGMAQAGLQTRRPRIHELVIFAPDPDNPARLVEVMLPGNSSEIDFRAANFNATILGLLSSASAEKVLLCDRLRVSSLSAFAGFSAAQAGNARFELTQTPSDSALSSTSPGTSAWTALPWAQGIASSSSGLRQATLRIELQVEPRSRPAAGTAATSIAIPFFGSASYRYAYQP